MIMFEFRDQDFIDKGSESAPSSDCCLILSMGFMKAGADSGDIAGERNSAVMECLRWVCVLPKL